MTRTTAILLAVMTGTVWAQNPNIIQNTKSQLQAVDNKQTAETNAALQAVSGNSAASQKKPSAQTKPAAGQAAVKPVSAIQAKPASVPAQSGAASKSATPAPSKPVTMAQAKPATASPAAAKPTPVAPVKAAVPAAPAKVVPVQAQNKPAIATPAKPATQTNAVPVKAMSIPAKPLSAPTPVAAAKQAQPTKSAPPAQGKVAVVPMKPMTAAPAKSANPMQPKPVTNAAPSKAAAAAKPAAPVKPSPETKAAPKATDSKAENSGDDTEKKQTYATGAGRRDPFVSPIVQHIGGSGCNTGKRCLAIDQILLKGIIKSEGGMIAVVVNSADKAYFLRENDPVFNGYVVKITGDSVVFQETFQDRLGKMGTREVTKKITVPAV